MAYYIHDLTFFFFLCFLPLGKHFHVITSLFNVFFMRLDRGNVKPVQHGVSDEELDDLESFGVKKLEDFTWKHMLDFYSCADCGRCSDNCPANAVKRPLSPRFISIKGRDLIFANYPILWYGSRFQKSEDLIGTIYEEDEIWSCTTCGACEQECPLGIEYIDKIVDLRRAWWTRAWCPSPAKTACGRWKSAATPGAKWKRNGPTGPRTCPRRDRPVTCWRKKRPKPSISWTASPPMMTACRRSARPRLPSFPGPVRISASWAKGERQRQRVRRFGEEMLFQDHEGPEHRCHPQPASSASSPPIPMPTMP
jgi:ferredoxin